MSIGCDACRARKVRCAREDPDDAHQSCKHCVALGIKCTYDYQPKKRGPPNLSVYCVSFHLLLLIFFGTVIYDDCKKRQLLQQRFSRHHLSRMRQRLLPHRHPLFQPLRQHSRFHLHPSLPLLHSSILASHLRATLSLPTRKASSNSSSSNNGSNNSRCNNSNIPSTHSSIIIRHLRTMGCTLPTAAQHGHPLSHTPLPSPAESQHLIHPIPHSPPRSHNLCIIHPIRTLNNNTHPHKCIIRILTPTQLL